MNQVAGLHVVRKPVARVVAGLPVVREGSTGRVVEMVPRVGRVLMLPRVWAVADAPEAAEASVASVEAHISESRCGAHADVAPVVLPAPVVKPRPELAFYRKYTEAMLRRYLRLSMAAGRVPSLLGRELFRGNVTSYRVNSFEDVVIFCHDMEKLLARLDEREKELIRRVALQCYTQAEAAPLLGLSLRGCVRRYAAAVDRVTRLLMEAKMLDPQKCCQ